MKTKNEGIINRLLFFLNFILDILVPMFAFFCNIDRVLKGSPEWPGWLKGAIIAPSAAGIILFAGIYCLSLTAVFPSENKRAFSLLKDPLISLLILFAVSRDLGVALVQYGGIEIAALVVGFEIAYISYYYPSIRDFFSKVFLNKIFAGAKCFSGEKIASLLFGAIGLLVFVGAFGGVLILWPIGLLILYFKLFIAQLNAANNYYAFFICAAWLLSFCPLLLSRIKTNKAYLQMYYQGQKG
ncbi:MAG: hypothetical protein QME05_04480 [Candidatus Margulisbacteria bacterium]|nr:hypothetical protein [Candidatus Margulisiibacteriota bacterium]